MAKATGQNAGDAAAKKKPTSNKAAAKTRTAAKPAAKRAVASKAASKKPPVKKAGAAKKPGAKKPAATKVKRPAKAPAKAKKTATTVKAAGRKTAAGRATRAAKAKAPGRARAGRRRSAVLDVSPMVIDTAAAAEVAARLVVEGSGVAHSQPGPLGNVFEPPTPVVQRGSSALRHVKEMLHRPVAAQLDSVFGPAPVPAAAVRRFAQGGRNARVQRLGGSTNFHVAQPTVPHRTAGSANSHDRGGGE